MPLTANAGQRAMTTKRLINSLLAGVVSALMIQLNLLSGGALFFLSLLSPIPIFLTGYAYGTLASIIAALFACFALFITIPYHIEMLVAAGNNAQNAIISIQSYSILLHQLIQYFAPAVLVTWFIGLSRPVVNNNQSHHTTEQQIMWYPISNILFYVSLWFAVAYSVAWNLIIPSDILSPQNLVKLLPDGTFNNQTLETISLYLPMLVAYITALSSVLLISLNLYFSLILARKMKILKRPKEFWPNHLRMSKNSLYAFLLMFVLSFFLPINGLGSIFICLAMGALSAGFLMSGYAIVHAKIPPSPYRSFLLTCIYCASILLSSLLIIVFIIIGMCDTRERLTLSKPLNTSNL